MPLTSYIYILLFFLVIALFLERYCFVIAVYKTKNYGYVLILVVIFFNSIFLYLISRLRTKKHKKRLHELYNIESAPNVGFCVISLVGCIDMLKSFFLFWPANVMPIWLLVSMLQLFIPLNMILRSCCINNVLHYNIHWISALVIIVGCIVSAITLQQEYNEDTVSTFHFFNPIFFSQEGDDNVYYSILLLISCFLDVISHTIKEALVRSQPLNQEKFNFKISAF